MSSIEVKEIEATTIQTTQERYCSTIFVEQSKCDVPHAEEHKDNENEKDTYIEKEEHNTCFEHEDQKEDDDPSNQVSYMEIMHVIKNRMICTNHFILNKINKNIML